MNNELRIKNKNYQGGQALILLLFFMMVGITITTAAVAIIGSNSLAATDVAQGEVTRQMAESGTERAILQILRIGSTYTGETLTNTINTDWDSGWNVVITVSYDSSTSTYTITSKATAGNYIKTVRATAGYNISNELTLNTWKEVN